MGRLTKVEGPDEIMEDQIVGFRVLDRCGS
jgi:hypothetical protein